MFRFFIVFLAAALIGLNGEAAGAATPAPHATAVAKSAKSSHGRSLGHAAIHEPQKGRPISAAACNQRAASMPGSVGTLGPNGASSSSTLVSIPIGGGNTAATTQARQITEACAHMRR